MSVATVAARGCPNFSQWLLAQKARTDAIGELAKCAAADPGFPRDGDIFAAWKRLNQLQADGEMLVAMEEAEADWGALQ